MKKERGLRIALAGLLLTIAMPALAASVEEEVGRRVDMIRAVKAGQSREVTEKYNKDMDEAWRYFEANKPAALPILRRKLSEEIRAANPSQLVLLDIGHFLYRAGTEADAPLAREALFRLDPTTDIVRWNRQDLFYLAHRAARDHDARVLSLIERAFLRDDKAAIAVPQHAMTLSATLASAFLYGVYGPDAEAALRAALADPALALRAIEVLVWTGSPDSVPAVGQAMRARGDYETFIRGVSFMMLVGGPQGRDFLLALDPAAFDTKSREYFARVKAEVAAANYEKMRGAFAGFPGDARLDGEEIRARLSAMIANAGRDDRTAPQAFLESDLPTSFLIGQLQRVRQSTFQRISDEALTDVKITNALMTALRYKEKGAR
ncbi:MAG: hypothetical protein ACXWHZ_09625 [Usitatibacter sp.]